MELYEGKKDCSGYINVGEVDYNVSRNSKKLYIMVSPEKIQKWGNLQYDVVYTQNPDGTGIQFEEIPVIYKERIRIYPEHTDDEYGEIFIGKKKSGEVLRQKHSEFVSKLQTYNGYVVLHHDSNHKITDGVIKKGKPNIYSNNTDVGIYFWASRESGKDPSNNTQYTYYCLIDKSQLYDFETNEKRLSLRQALSKYQYAGQYWRDGAVCVNTFYSTPIWRICDRNNKWYDAEWNRVKCPFSNNVNENKKHTIILNENEFHCFLNEIVKNVVKNYLKKIK